MRRFGQAEAVLSRAGRYHEAAPNLRVKEVLLDGVRYIVCHNPEQAEHDRLAREAMVKDLELKLKDGLKSLIGNRGYLRPVYHWTEQRVRGPCWSLSRGTGNTP